MMSCMFNHLWFNWPIKQINSLVSINFDKLYLYIYILYKLKYASSALPFRLFFAKDLK